MIKRVGWSKMNEKGEATKSEPRKRSSAAAMAGAERGGRRDGNRNEDETSLFQKSERERRKDKEGEKSRKEGVRTRRESERGRNAAKKIDDGKGWQKSCARWDESLSLSLFLCGTEIGFWGWQRWEEGRWFPLYSTGARMRERRQRGGSWYKGGRGGWRSKRGDQWDAGGSRACWVDGCWYGFQEEREGEGWEQRVVGALLIPVCADWAKRGASGSARERDRTIHRRTGARRRHRRADRSRRQILEMRSPLTRHAAAPADESTRRIEERERKEDIHPRRGEFTPGWIIRSRWRSIGVSEGGTARGVPREIARGIIQSWMFRRSWISRIQWIAF